MSSASRGGYGGANIISPIVSYPSGASSSFREESSLHGGFGGASVVAPIVSYPSGGASSSYREESSSSRGGFGGGSIVAPIVAYPSGGASSSYREESSSSHGGFGGGSIVAPIVSYPSGGASSTYREESSSSGGSGLGNAGFITYGQPVSRFGGADFGSSFGSSNLGTYMSESERMARIQAQNLQGSAGYRASSALDLGNAHLTNAGAGGQTKSWEKSTKWSSNTEVSNLIAQLKKKKMIWKIQF